MDRVLASTSEMNISSDKRPIVVDVNGIIGAGKTTYIRRMEEMFRTRSNLKVVVIPEPVEEWLKSGMLQLFYEDKARWAYEFQTVVLFTRIRVVIETMKDNPDADMFIMERSYVVDKLFMLCLVEDGSVSEQTMNNYSSWSEFVANKLMPCIQTLFLYLRAPTSTCMERVTKRNRLGEEHITLEYQERLAKHHDEMFLKNVQIGDHSVPCHTVDVSREMDDELVQQMYEQLSSLI